MKLDQFTVFILSGVVALVAMYGMVIFQVYHPTDKGGQR